MAVGINPLVRDLGQNPFVRLHSLLSEQPRTNREPVNLAVGEPQHQPPAFVAEEIARQSHLWNRYPNYLGMEELRQASADWLNRRYGLDTGYQVDAGRHLITVAGSKEALFLLGLAFVPPAEGGRRRAVLMPSPYYLVYSGSATIAGGEPVFLDAVEGTGFLPDLASLTPELLERTSLFFLCSPANPQGVFAELEYLKELIGLARRYGFVLVLDECYAEIYDRAAPPGGLQACQALGSGFDNVLVVHSLSKRSNAAGLRLGFVAGDERLIQTLRTVRSFGSAQVPLPVQAAGVALWRDEAHVDHNRALYRAKIDAAEAALGRDFGFYRPPGGFFLWLDVGDGEAVTRRLWREAAVRVLPGSYISGPSWRVDGEDAPMAGERYIRVALVHPAPLVEETLDRVRALL